MLSAYEETSNSIISSVMVGKNKLCAPVEGSSDFLLILLLVWELLLFQGWKRYYNKHEDEKIKNLITPTLVNKLNNILLDFIYIYKI